jgi:hypothetical protein
MRLRTIIGSVATGVIALGVPAALAASASAATNHTTTAVTHITNRYDGGGNGNWAYDSFNRTLTIEYLGKSADLAYAATPYMYTAQLKDTGTFRDIPGAFTPNQGGHDAGKVLRPTQVTGAMNGFGDFGVFYSSARVNSPHTYANEGVPIRLRGVIQNGLPQFASPAWPELAFPAGTTFSGVNEAWWGYTYQVPATVRTVTIHGVKHVIRTKAQNWVDAAWNGDGQLPHDGNITGR